MVQHLLSNKCSALEPCTIPLRRALNMYLSTAKWRTTPGEVACAKGLLCTVDFHEQEVKRNSPSTFDLLSSCYSTQRSLRWPAGQFRFNSYGDNNQFHSCAISALPMRQFMKINGVNFLDIELTTCLHSFYKICMEEKRCCCVCSTKIEQLVNCHGCAKVCGKRHWQCSGA